MSKVCALTGKRPIYGNNVSHANNHTRTRWEPNLHTKRIWIEEEKRWVKVKISAKAMKIMSKTGTAELAKLLK